MNPYLEVVTAALIWGTSGMLIKLIDTNSFMITFFRMAIPTALIGAYLFYKRKPVFRQNTKTVLLASFLNAVRTLFYFIGFNNTSIGNAIIMLYTWPIFVTLIGPFMLKERITPVKIVSLAAAFGGIIFVYIDKKFSFESSDFIGMSAMLFSAFVYAFSMILFKKTSADYSQIETTFFQNFVGAFLFLPAVFIVHPFPGPDKIALLFVFGIFIGIIGFALFFSALKKVKASIASSLAYLEIVSTLVYSAVFFGERFTWNMVVGGLLIVLSALIVQRYGSRPEGSGKRGRREKEISAGAAD
jgi:drug/metabolite transporter (DMT)-like permease